MDLDVALDPLGAHGKVWTPLTCITHAIARSHTDTLRRVIDGDEGRVGVP